MNVLALDPSLSSTGYSIIDSKTKKILVKGKIKTKRTTININCTDDRIQEITERNI